MFGSRTGFSKHSVSGSPIISQFRVFAREIIDLSNAVFVWIAKKLLIAVLNLLCRFLFPLLIRLGNLLRVCGDCLTTFPNKPCLTVSNFLISSRFTRNNRFVQCHLCVHFSDRPALYANLRGLPDRIFKHSVSGSPIISQF